MVISPVINSVIFSVISPVIGDGGGVVVPPIIRADSVVFFADNQTIFADNE